MICSTDFPSIPLIKSNLSELWTIPDRKPLADWAEENITLSSEYAASSTQLRLYGWQREVLNAFTDPNINNIVCCFSTQTLKTLNIQLAIAYIICEDPGPILLVQPNDDDARTFSKERLAPMIRDNACLRDKVTDSVYDKINTLTGKQFPGGNLSLVGAVAPGNLARRSIRYLFCDEVDKYPISAGKEGDPLDLASERLVSFKSRSKSIYCCSPTLAGQSRIAQAYRESDMREPWVPCHSCGQLQVLRWEQVRWPKRQPQHAQYHCKHCQIAWSDLDRKRACDLTTWIARKPGNKTAGFWLSQLYAPWKTMADLAEKWLKVYQIPNRRQTFVNTVLAEEFQGEGSRPDDSALFARREHYTVGPTAVLPRRSLFLTAAVDVQDSPPRLEVEVRAWGRDLENWSILYDRLRVYAPNGESLPVTSPELWEKLDELLQLDWLHESGHRLPILVMGIDTGNRPKPVYDFAKRHSQLDFLPSGIRLRSVRTVVPVKGTDDELRLISGVSKEDAARRRQGVKIVSVGTHCAKQEIYDLLHNRHPKPDGSLSGLPSPGCYHFPMYDREYFEGLTSEVRVVRPGDVIAYEKRSPNNHPLDLAVYNRAMAAIVGIDRFSESDWQKLEYALTAAVSISPADMEALTAAQVLVVTPEAAEMAEELDDLVTQQVTATVSPSISPNISTSIEPTKPPAPIPSSAPITVPKPTISSPIPSFPSRGVRGRFDM